MTNNKTLEEKIITYLDKLEKNEISLAINSKKKKKLLENKAEYEKIKQMVQEYEELLVSITDEKEQKILSAEMKDLTKQQERLITVIKEQIIEEEETKQNVVMELRPGTGGVEAGFFAGDLYRMYAKLAESKGWKIELTESKVDKTGSFTFVSFLVKGEKVYNWLKNEAGVHRVQRVPKTESKGRIHTSTVTVVVLPEPSDITLTIRSQDLRIDTYRASGAGGQHVNTTDSAVRITHLPTGVIATSQDGRSQHDNKEKALFILKTRILEKLQSEKIQTTGNLRSSMIGKAGRPEKIRTYNWPQNRVTDHRLGITWNKLNFIIEGECEEICQKLMDYEVEKKISE